MWLVVGDMAVYNTKIMTCYAILRFLVYFQIELSFRYLYQQHPVVTSSLAIEMPVRSPHTREDMSAATEMHRAKCNDSITQKHY